MISQKESNLVRKDSWLPKLLSRDMKTKTKNKSQPQTIIKNNRKKNRKVKAMRNITTIMDR